MSAAAYVYKSQVVDGCNGGGSVANQLSYPLSIYVDDNNDLYVGDVYNSRVQKFPQGSSSATNGITVAGGNGNGSNPNQISNPNGIHVSSNGNIYIAESYGVNRRVSLWG